MTVKRIYKFSEADGLFFPAMRRKHWFLIILIVLSSVQAVAQTSELEAFLYIQSPHIKGEKDAVYVLWIPQPVLKYCVGRPFQECINIDFCIRTTSKQVKQCQNLPIDISRIPRYPPNTHPSRVLGITFYPAAPIKGWDKLLQHFKSKPETAFDRLTAATRIKAKIKLTRKPDDDDFEMLEVLDLPPS